MERPKQPEDPFDLADTLKSIAKNVDPAALRAAADAGKIPPQDAVALTVAGAVAGLLEGLLGEAKKPLQKS